MTAIVPNVILLRRGRPMTVGSFDFNTTLDLPTSASFGTPSQIYNSSTTATTSTGFLASLGQGISNLVSGATNLVQQVAPAYLSYKTAAEAQKAQARVIEAQTRAQISAMSTPAPSTVVVTQPAPRQVVQAAQPAAPATGGMSSALKIGIGVGAAAMVGLVVLSASRRGRES